MSYYFSIVSDFVKTKIFPESSDKNSEVNLKLGRMNDMYKGNQESFNHQFVFWEEENISHQNLPDITDNNLKANNCLDTFSSNKILSSSNDVNNEKSQADDILLSETIREQDSQCLVRIGANNYPCKVIITDFRVIIKLLKCNSIPNWSQYSSDYFDIPLLSISSVDKAIEKKMTGKYLLEITSKDGRLIHLLVNLENKKIYGTLLILIKPRDINGYMQFAIQYRKFHPCSIDGWQIYEPLKEFSRQGVRFEDESGQISTSLIRLSWINAKYFYCESYPELIMTPKSITDEDLQEAGNFRTQWRLPILSYFHRMNNASIWRSSQPKSGLTDQRNTNDEKLLKAITDISTEINRLVIFDARPYANALGNRLKGAGFENVDYYPRSEIIFCEIENIHSVRNAHAKLLLLINSNQFHENKNFLAQLEQTGWCDILYQIIKSANSIASYIQRGYSVLVHCSDGWDRSSQISALAQLLIDPYYRTLEGFIVLIEKEFLSLGHQFGYRSGFYGPKDFSEDQLSPIFLQWLDCVHQVVVQFPHLFEFNLDLLLFIAYHLSSCKYGTFLFNSEKQRQDKNAKNVTVSIWTDVYQFKDNFINPFYDTDNPVSQQNILLPTFSVHKIRFWEEYFLRYIQLNHSLNKLFENPKHLMMQKQLQANNGNYNILSLVSSPPKSTTMTNVKYVELEKKSDVQTIKKKKSEIDKLKEILKELSAKILLKVNDFNTLSQGAKDYMKDIQKGEFMEEEGYVVIKSQSQFNK